MASFNSILVGKSAFSAGKVIYANTTTGLMFRSTNNGTKWQVVNIGLPAFSLSGVCTYGAALFIGTVNDGILLSTNNGNTWTDVSAGLPTKLTVGIRLCANDKYLFAGISPYYAYPSRGVWRRPFSEMVNAQFSAKSRAITFSPTHSGSQSTDTLLVRNLGDTTLVISSLVSDNPRFTATPTVAAIAPSDSQSFTLTFAPTEPLAATGHLLVLHNGSSSPDTISLTGHGTMTLQSGINGGWNLVSVPVGLVDYSKQVVFPGTISPAYSYESSYQKKDTLTNGVGYWIKSSAANTSVFEGTEIDLETLRVNQGWNLIGSLSHSIPVDSITTNPPGLSTGNFFGYSGSYHTVDTIISGSGYWVKVSNGGELILNTVGLNSLLAVNRISITSTSEMPPPPPSDGSASVVSLPEQFGLRQNYPNPFNPSTIINYDLPDESIVRIVIYNMVGQVVVHLRDGIEAAGFKSAEWNATNFSSGLYFYRLEAFPVANPTKTFTQMRKMLLIK